MPANRQNSPSLGAWGETADVRRRFGYPSPRRPAQADAVDRRVDRLEARVTELEAIVGRLVANYQRAVNLADPRRERLP